MGLYFETRDAENFAPMEKVPRCDRPHRLQLAATALPVVQLYFDPISLSLIPTDAPRDGLLRADAVPHVYSALPQSIRDQKLAQPTQPPLSKHRSHRRNPQHRSPSIWPFPSLAQPQAPP